MLNAIIQAALKNRLFVLALSLVFSILGFNALRDLPVDIFPDLNKPTITLMTEAHGMAPEEVETLVTIPLEKVLNGLPGLDQIRSSSGIGLSVIYLQFDWKSEIYRKRQLVSERLRLVRERLPKDIFPVMGPITSIMGQIQLISVSADPKDVNPIDLRTTADWVIRPRLLGVPGVAQVISIGGGLKQYQILISAERMNHFQLTIESVDHELSLISQNTTGGFLNKDGQEHLVRNIGMATSVEDLENSVVGQHFGRPVLVKDIASVKIGHRIKRGDGSHNAHDSVIMSIQKQPGSDTVQITRRVNKVIEEIKKTLPNSISVNPHVFKQASFIEASIRGIQDKLIFGSILIFIVLIAFLSNLRITAITLTAIPLSFLFTFLAFRYFGLTVNTMTLGGLAIAIGELVDDAIVDIENVFRRLRENSKLSEPRPRLQVIYEASSEVRNSIVVSTLIIALVFVPLLNLTGLEGQLFPPLAIAYLTALLASLVVSLTVTPVLSYYLVKGESLKQYKDNRWVLWLKHWNQLIVSWALDRPKQIILAAVVLLISALSVIPLMGRDFLPQFNEGSALISVIATPGISLEESHKIGRRAEELILKTPEVASVVRRTGRAELDEHAEGVNNNELAVEFKENLKRTRDEIVNEIRTNLSELKGVSVNVGQPVSHMIDHMLSGVTSQIAVKLFGNNLGVLRQKAAEIYDQIKDIPGLVDVRVEQQGLVPQVKVHVFREESAKFNISSGHVTSLLESALNGEVAAQVIEEQKIFDVFFRFDESSRADIEAIKNTVVKIMPNGKKVRLYELADVYETGGPNKISRESGQRRIIVSANVSGRDLLGAVEAIKKKVQSGVDLPEGYYVVYGGQFESQKSASRKIFWYGFFALILIALILYIHFRSKNLVAQIMLTIPFAFVGGVWSVFLLDSSLTIANLIGFITLCGIATRNGVMMISHFVHLEEREGETFSKKMVLRGCEERLVPILMTALTAAGGLAPLVGAKGEPGSEILYPVALVIVGGLLTSTVLNLVVTPTIYYWLGERRTRR